MSSEVEYGRPVFTSGVFGTARAENDLGIEDVGAGLLRRLIPGVIQNTPNAGYYSFYPYLLWKWQQAGESTDLASFVPFYRRHEAAFAMGCVLHDHRDGAALSGVNGAISARARARELRGGSGELDLEQHARTYMDTPLGGYRLFYAAALQDARLVVAGADGLVDRVSDHGRSVAQRFAEAFEQTAYYQHHFDGTNVVPIGVLEELGKVACLCAVPQRSDHEALLETFFGSPLSSSEWEERRIQRVQSLVLLLEFHAQRPPDDEDGLAAWRHALVEPRFSSGRPWTTTHTQTRESWRAYQLREIQVLCLTTIWSIYIAELVRRERATHQELAEELVSWLNRPSLGFDPETSLDDAMAAAGSLLSEGYELALAADPLASEWQDQPKAALCRALRVISVLPREIGRTAAGFDELLDEGGDHRWSLRNLADWLEVRSQDPFSQVVSELLDALHHQHVRVALSKVRVPSGQNLRRVRGGWRDPFNFAEDDGVLRPLRVDEPFWTGARYGVCNHLLWTLGLLTTPMPPLGLTDLGRSVLDRYAADA